MKLDRKSAEEILDGSWQTSKAEMQQDVLEGALKIIQDVKTNGLSALLSNSIQFGDITDKSQPLILKKPELEAAFYSLPECDQLLLQRVAQRISRFAEAQKSSISEFDLPLPLPGLATASQRISPMERAGCYAPGGRFPLPSSVLMTAITARVAGVSQVVVASPRPALITKAAAFVAGADALLVVGGAQAIAALAYGCTEIGLEPCDVIAGPGNQWVTAAKRIVSGDVAIDMLAGPSELLIIADEFANPETVAADLLAQAEHDTVALPILVTPNEALVHRVEEEIEKQLNPLSTRSTAEVSLKKNGFVVVTRDLTSAAEVANKIAPEHLEVLCSDLDSMERQLNHYGALFLGSDSAEVLGDYGIGPNHTLPTSGTARFSGGLSVFNFLRIRTHLKIANPCSIRSVEGQQIVNDSIKLAELEGLMGHAQSASKRIGEIEHNESIEIPLRHDIHHLDGYVPVKPTEELAKEFGIDVNQIIKIDANENLYPMPESVRRDMEASLANVHIYPDPSSNDLRKALSSFYGVKLGKILTGSGADELIDLVMRAFLPQKIVICPPTFGMYEFFGKINESKIVSIPRSSFPDFSVDIQGIQRAVLQGAQMVFLASPNNPTGTRISSSDLKVLCRLPALIVLDEAYADFASEDSMDIFRSGQFANLVILRTFSKWAGLAGLRIGYAFLPEYIFNAIMKIKQPYNVNVVGQAAATSALIHRNEIEFAIHGMIQERQRMISQLKKIDWIHPAPSEANFVICKIAGINVNKLHNLLREKGVFVRCYSKKPGDPLDNFLRFSCGRPQDTDALICALESIKGTPLFSDSIHLLEKTPQILLFDMDGVLADVTKSYRKAIEATTRHFGVSVDMDMITNAKCRGNANNDWKLCQWLIKEHSTDNKLVPLDDIVDVFQKVYHKLRDDETLLISRDLLNQLSKQYPMGIVTGRPREEALYFLRFHNIESMFSSLVCMEDTALPKPSPEPVQKCFSALCSTSNDIAWFIGDTPDDVVAALHCAENIVPIGFGNLFDALYAAGAPRSFRNFDFLQSLLDSKPGRKAHISRVTKETSIDVRVDLDGSGEHDIQTGIGFFDHMLSALSKHSNVDIALHCTGDLWIDDHHSVEDCSIALGHAFDQALGERKGILRFGSALAPLDEALVRTVIDISGRPSCSFNLDLDREKVGDLSCEMVEHIFLSFATAFKCTLHIDLIRGRNSHHKVEAAFKSLALALKQAISRSGSNDVPSTKGVL